MSEYRLCEVQILACLLYNAGNHLDLSMGSANTYADVAQPAEQLICNQQAVGSNPTVGSKSPHYFLYCSIVYAV